MLAAGTAELPAARGRDSPPRARRRGIGRECLPGYNLLRHTDRPCTPQVRYEYSTVRSVRYINTVVAASHSYLRHTPQSMPTWPGLLTP